MMLALLIASSAWSGTDEGVVLRALREFAGKPEAGTVEEAASSVAAERRDDAVAALDRLDTEGLSRIENRRLIRAYAYLGATSRCVAAAGASDGGRLEAAGALADAGDYASAEALARSILEKSPSDHAALSILHSVRGRSSPADAKRVKRPAEAVSSRAESRPDAPSAAMPAAFSRAATAPPAPGVTPLDPRSPDYWDRQLLSPLLVRSDSNPVARRYLSPLIRDGKVTIRLVAERDDPSIRGAWGTYDPKTSIIKYNLDAINLDAAQYSAHYARKDPSKVVRPISPARPLDARQVEFLTGRFLPLAVHEAGGHGTHGDALRARLGVGRSPISKDTEILAFRLEAAAIEWERRRDPNYLTEPTVWARDEGKLTRKWLEYRQTRDDAAFSKYLDGMGYGHLVAVAQASSSERERLTQSALIIQTRCRISYDAECAKALDLAVGLVPERVRPRVVVFVERLRRNPDDDALRFSVARALSDLMIRTYRMDPKGVREMRRYYAREESRVEKLEATADPRSAWSRLVAGLGIGR